MLRNSFSYLAMMLFLTAVLTGCSLPGWNEQKENRIEPAETIQEEPELDFSGIFIGNWMEWSEARDALTGYSYVFYEDGLILVSRSDSDVSILEGHYQFIGNNTFSVVWRLPGSEITFEIMIWEIVAISKDVVNFTINDERPFTLKRFIEESPPLVPPPFVEPPAPPQTPAAEIESVRLPAKS